MSAPGGKWPRLTDSLPFGTRPGMCASCGASPKVLDRWQEHDDRDRPEAKVVLLCATCSARIVEPHPRLYCRLVRHEFVPGSASVCDGCRWQHRMCCKSPIAHFNGAVGPGLEFTPRPAVAHMRVKGGGRWMAFETEPVTHCTGRGSA